MNITSVLIYCFIATFTPGPTNIVILSTVHHFGAKKAMKYTFGAFEYMSHLK
ncbi:threonine/homoserine/homoserine lactone efflux protein [Paenibacillus sp. 1182]|jgi:threonine/homoserine/homoserine lactone efflux protein|nr:threonine/homoserine/homoserine lactone efflux protein [Paenibacillus sp. 1182]